MIHLDKEVVWKNTVKSRNSEKTLRINKKTSKQKKIRPSEILNGYGKVRYFISFSIMLQMFTGSYRGTLPSLQGNSAIFTGETCKYTVENFTGNNLKMLQVFASVSQDIPVILLKKIFAVYCICTIHNSLLITNRCWNN